MALIAERGDQVAPGVALHVSYVGCLGGLIALARGEADLARRHLRAAVCDCSNTAATGAVRWVD